MSWLRTAARQRFDETRLSGEALAAWGSCGEDERDQIRLSVLAAEAEQFLTAGGSFGPVEWLTLDSLERQAMTLAGGSVRSALAGATGIAAQSAKAAASVMSLADGGASLKLLKRQEARAILDAKVNEIAERLADPSRGLDRLAG